MCPRLPGSPAPATAGALTAITRQTLCQARARGQRTHGLPGCRPQKCSPAGLFLPPPRSVSFPSSLCNFRAQPLYFPQFAHDAVYALQTALYQSFSTFLNSPQLYCHCSATETLPACRKSSRANTSTCIPSNYPASTQSRPTPPADGAALAIGRSADRPTRRGLPAASRHKLLGAGCRAQTRPRQQALSPSPPCRDRSCGTGGESMRTAA